MMKAWLKGILLVVFVAVFCVGIRAIVSLSGKQRDQFTCNRLEINITDSLRFISEGDIRELLHNEYGPFIGQKAREINLGAIESIVRSQACVSKAEAWMTDDCTLHISVRERKPEIKVMPDGRDGFYADSEGKVFPLCEDFEADVPVISGAIPEGDAWIQDILAFVVKADRLGWTGRFGSIGIDKDGDLEVTLLEGEESYILGRTADAAENLPMIDKYLDTIKGTEEYTSVNLKYSNQIICSRKDI